MKRITKLVVVSISVVIGLVSMAFADSLSIGDSLKKIPALKQGIGYSLKNSNIEYLTTIELANYKGIALEAGYTSQDKVIGVISYPILKLKDLGVTVPILDLVEANAGLFYGFGRINIMELDTAEDTYGVSLTLLKVKF